MGLGGEGKGGGGGGWGWISIQITGESISKESPQDRISTWD